MSACPYGISKKFTLWSLSSLRKKTAGLLSFFSKQETRFQKDMAMLSLGNSLILGKNWLFEAERMSETTARFVGANPAVFQATSYVLHCPASFPLLCN